MKKCHIFMMLVMFLLLSASPVQANTYVSSTYLPVGRIGEEYEGRIHFGAHDKASITECKVTNESELKNVGLNWYNSGTGYEKVSITIWGTPNKYGKITVQTYARDNAFGYRYDDFTIDIWHKEGLTINAEYFPDSAFRTYISANFDKDSNGYLSDNERSQVTSISLPSKNISDLSGLGYFPELEYLDCSKNNLTSLNTYGNPKLKYLDCSGNKITGFDLKNNTALAELYCGNNSLTALDISKNTALTELYCSSNQISYLNVSMCSDLKVLDCAGNMMSTLTLGNLSQLKSLKCGNNNLSLIDVSGSPNLSSGTFTHDSGVQIFTGIAVNATNFPDANFRACIDTDGNGVLSYTEVNVTSLFLPSENISSLKGIEYFTALTFLNCSNNSLTALDLSKNTALETLDCSNNHLASLILGYNSLTSLYCSSNSLTALDLSKNTALETLDCSSNSLTALDLSKNTALETLDCSNNRLASLILGYNSLTRLDCSHNSLTALDVSKNIALTALDCSYNRLASLILGATAELIDLTCENNKLTQLDISGCPKLKGFARDSGIKIIDRLGVEINAANFPDSVFRSYVSGFDTDGSGFIRTYEVSGVSKIDLSNKNISSLKGIECFTELAELNCSHNRLTALDVSKNTALWWLYCNDNSLITLDVSKNTALWSLYCENNKLTTLTLGKNSQLDDLTCQNNNLTQLNITDCPQLQSKYYDVYNDKYIYRNIEYDSGVKIVTDQPFVEQPSGIQVSAVNFPDEIFRAYVSENFDTDSNGALSEKEINAVTTISVSSKGISSLKGVEYFTALTMLRCGYNQLTALDVSNNTALTDLLCEYNQLTALDVSNNTLLTDLLCHENKLTALDVSKNTALMYLDCHSNLLTRLILGDNSVLSIVKCKNNKLTQIDISGCPKLPSGTFTHDSTVSVIDSTPSEVAINATNFPDANFRAYISKNFDTDGNGALSDDEISAVTTISVYGVYGKIISSLGGIEYFTALTSLYCGDNRLTELDVSNNTALTSLYCGDNRLTELDVSNNTALTYLNCGDNQLTELDVSNNTALTTLYCDGNQLTKLDVSKNTALTYLFCHNNQLTELDVSHKTALRVLECYNNQLTKLDVSNNTALFRLYCYNNQLTELDVSNNTALNMLDCYNNQLTKLDVSKDVALTSLLCHNNQLTELDVSQNTALGGLDCRNNQLIALDVSNNTALNRLICYNNQLTSLVLGNKSVLDTLKCQNNNLTQIDISGCPKLSSGTFTHDSTISIIDGKSALRVTTSSLASGTVGTPYSQTLDADCYTVIPDDDGTAYWTLTGGSLPGGLTLSSTGVISGTPTASGNYTFTVKAEYGGSFDTKSFTLTITAAPQPTNTLTITNTSLASGEWRVFYRETFTAEYMGSKVNAVWSATGLPSWLTLDSDTGELRGIAEDWSAITFTVKAVYGNMEAVKEFTLDIEDLPLGATALAIENKSLAPAETGKYYTEKLTAYTEDSTPLGGKILREDAAWTIDYGSLPDGLSLNASTGEISGTPTKAGDYTFIVTAYVSYEDIKASKQFTLSVASHNDDNDPPETPAFKNFSLMLEGQIGVNFYAYLPEISGVTYTPENCWTEFNIRGDTSPTPQPLDYEFFTTISGVKYYGFRCYINAAQMADTITATLHYGNGKTVTKEYSAKTYLNAALNITSFSGVIKNLMVAIKNYGHYVQPMLSAANGWTIGEKYLFMEKASDLTDTDISGAYAATSNYAFYKELNGTGIEKVNYSLILGAETTINLYLVPYANYSGNVGAYVDGGTANSAVKQPNGQYLVQIPDIAAKDLGETHTIEIAAGGESTVKVSALSYAYGVLSMNSTSTTIQNMKLAVTALYKYYEAAKAYADSRR